MPDLNEIIFLPNSSMDAEIKAMLPQFSPESQARMRKTILNAKKSAIRHQDENTDANARHIFREFIPASILNPNGFSFEYEKPIGGKRPDWLDIPTKTMLESYTFEHGGIGMGPARHPPRPIDFAAPVLMFGSRACMALGGSLLCSTR